MGLRLRKYIELRRTEPLRILVVQIGADARLQALDESVIGREWG